jgi:hypothetical protein
MAKSQRPVLMDKLSSSVCNRSNLGKTGRSCEGTDFSWLSSKVSQTLLTLYYNNNNNKPYFVAHLSQSGRTRHSQSAGRTKQPK